MMVEVDKARRLRTVLLDAIADLRRYQTTVSRESLKASRDAQHMVCHALYVAAQATVDLALHISADQGLAQPPTYQGVFFRLAEAGVIEGALAKNLAAWASFRNVLAHLYSTVDYDRVHAALSEVDDLERLAAIVSRRLG